MRRSTDVTNGDEMLWVFGASGDHADKASRLALLELPIAECVGRHLPPEAADLVEVAAAVHLVDRLAARPPARSPGDSWSRSLRLRIGVRDPGRWTDVAVSRELTDLLGWLTDDDWHIEFLERNSQPRPGEVVRFLFDAMPAVDAVALFSGGLDSLAGFVMDLEAGGSPLLVSVESNTRVAKTQRTVLASVAAAFNRPTQRVPVELHLSHTAAREPSQRARGFVFLALAAATAAVAEIDRLRVYENGVGALNLPYTEAQVGAQATRAMHPATLVRAASLFSQVLGSTMTVENSCQFRTKAEMCKELPQLAHAAALLTRSCDTAFAHRRTSIDSCGVCTSCLLRRQALRGAGLGHLDPSAGCRLDAFDASLRSDPRLYELRAMLTQAARLEDAVRNDDPWGALTVEFPDILDAKSALSSQIPASEVRSRLCSLYERYVSEWHRVPTPLVANYLTRPLQLQMSEMGG